MHPMQDEPVARQQVCSVRISSKEKAGSIPFQKKQGDYVKKGHALTSFLNVCYITCKCYLYWMIQQVGMQPMVLI